MNKAILELRRKRAADIAAAQQLIDGADGESRELTEQETGDYDALMADIENDGNEIKRRERLAALVDEIEIRTTPEADDVRIGMTAAETGRYSLVRAIRAAYDSKTGKGASAWNDAGLELEASRAVAERLEIEPRGFYIPFDVIESRDLTVGTDTAGGHTVSTDLLSENFIDLLRNRLVINAAGATVLAGLNGNIAIPRQTSGATAYWVAEGNAPTESQQAVDQLTMTPHTAGAWTDYSRRLMLQSSLDVENFVRTDLATVLALAIDYAGLHGDSGVDANQPDGVQATAGIGAVAIGANGGAPLWSHVVELETDVAVGNADMGRQAYVTNAKMRGKLKTTAKDAGSGLFLWGDGNTPLNGYPALVTNQVRSDLTKGSGTDLSAAFFGNWSDLIVGLWGGLDILVDPYSNSTTGTMRVVALQDVDFGIRNVASFSAIVDADTT